MRCSPMIRKASLFDPDVPLGNDRGGETAVIRATPGLPFNDQPCEAWMQRKTEHPPAGFGYRSVLQCAQAAQQFFGGEKRIVRRRLEPGKGCNIANACAVKDEHCFRKI